MNKQGTIIKATGGFYYVKCGTELIECRARGIFRKEGISPLCGDTVTISVRQVSGEKAASGKGDKTEGTIEQIAERRNFLLRPPVANLDQLLIVVSVSDPEPNLFVIDKLTAIAEIKKIEPVIVISKADLSDDGLPERLCACYVQAGFAAHTVSNRTGEGMEAVKAALAGKISAFTGNSGVGKSSLLNLIDERLGLEVGETSKKLGRGRHTTRTVELFELDNGGIVADTPGFSSLDIERFETVFKEDLQYAFREFEPYLNDCRFTGCAHMGDKGCAVCAAVERGEIPRSRYESYCALYNQVKDLKEWELKKKTDA